MTDEAIVGENEMITWEAARKIEALGVDKILVRSPMTCQAALGVCRLCYGMDLATGNLVEEGMAVREGQVLARLDDSSLQAALRLYRAQLENNV